MNQDANTSNRRWIFSVIVLVVLALGGLAVWWLTVMGGRGEPASDEVAADFFTSLAALDVEENQLAATALARAVQAEPDEPTLWANLTVAHLRLRDMENAQRTLERAVALAADVPEIIALQAEALEQGGDIDAAVEKLRQVYRIQPENVSAAYSLATLLGRIRTPEADAERLALLTDIVQRTSSSLRARCEQARLAATLAEATTLAQALDVLNRDASIWPDAARQRLAEAGEAAAADRFRDAATALTIFENLIKPLSAYQQSVAELGASETAIGTPLRRMIRLTLPPVEAAEADSAISFTLETISEAAARPDLVLALPQEGERRSTLMSLSNSSLQVGGPAALPFPGSSTDANPASILSADLNDDFLLDLTLAGPDGCRIFLQQEDRSFAPHETVLPEFTRAWRSVWTVDLDADGDLDLLLSDHESPLTAARNNGDVTFSAVDDLAGAISVVGFEAVDLDQDGDLDVATLEASGRVSVWLNDRNGRYIAAAPPTANPALAIAAGDVDRDGRFDLVMLTEAGNVERATLDADKNWAMSTITSWPAPVPEANLRGRRVRLDVADLDNNGAVDVIGSAAYQTVIWLGDEQGGWTMISNVPPMFVTSISDMNDDGLVDLVGMTEDSGGMAANRGRAGYGWLFVAPRATAGAGDKRINSFGIGGRIEVRAGYLVQAAAIRSPRVHFGLGRREMANVARIVWPNGVVQAEFDLQADTSVVAQQRLKGSCPWVFAFDGTEFRFVKDFIWRSPLGLRINAQDTAGVTQTEDWIKLPARTLAAADGHYSVRITAELWETHFFDQIALMVVDHPTDLEVFVDERFVATEAQDQTVHATTPPQPVVHPVDQSGRSLEPELRSDDEVYADSFALGPYQGLAEEHWVEFELPANVDTSREIVLVGNGWVYPTDSSLNLAIAQGSAAPPMGLVLEQHINGKWRTLRDGLGFPGGKNKDIVIALPEGTLNRSRRFRLRTTTESYWDSLAWAYRRSDFEPVLTPVPMTSATLRYRGYSKLVQPTVRRRPDIPTYHVEASAQRWLDLEGFYTRFGDVQPLLSDIDDRYVIMNAGDELALEFAVPDEPPAGWKRDFVLIGDGWVKDGDFNTAFSQGVRPLPAHDDRDYAGPLVPLSHDPMYLRHAEDWHNYHTRYVTPRRFQRGLWPPMTDETTKGIQP